MRGSKVSRPGATALAPVPAVIVTVGGFDGPRNAITLSWAGTLNSAPPLVGVSIRPERHSHHLVEQGREFVVNVPGPGMVEAIDLCGTLSGRDTDKFERAGLTPVRAELVAAPLVEECPLNLECRVTQVVRLGSHDLFVGEVVRVHVDPAIEGENGLRGFAVYGFGRYHELGATIGRHGFSLKR